MAAKEITGQADTLPALLDDYGNSMKAIRSEYQKSTPDATGPDASELEKLRSELALCRKLIGNYHPSKDSPTYRDLVDANNKRKKELAEQKAELDKTFDRCSALEAENSALTDEIRTIREAKFLKPLAEKVEQKQARPRKKKKHEPAKPAVSASEKKQRLRTLLFSWHHAFNDLQLAALEEILSDDRLPADDLVPLLDPSITPQRLKTMYQMVCRKNRVPVTPLSIEGLRSGNNNAHSDNAPRPDKKEPDKPAPVPIEPDDSDSSHDGARNRFEAIAQAVINIAKEEGGIKR